LFRIKIAGRLNPEGSTSPTGRDRYVVFFHMGNRNVTQFRFPLSVRGFQTESPDEKHDDRKKDAEPPNHPISCERPFTHWVYLEERIAYGANIATLRTNSNIFADFKPPLIFAHGSRQKNRKLRMNFA